MRTGQVWCGYMPRTWQAEALPAVRDALQRDVRACVRACTGAGKALLIAEIAARHLAETGERVVITVPTQALVEQIYEDVSARVPGRVGRYYQHHKDIDQNIIVACHASTYRGHAECPECTGREPDDITVREIDGDKRRAARTVWAEADAGGLDLDHQCREPYTHTRVCEVVERGCLAADLLDRDDRISLWISDECHKTECDQMLGWARWTDPRHVVGLTATPWRSQEGEGLSLFDELVYDYPPDAAMRDGVVLPPDIRPYTGPTADLDEVVAQMIQDVIAETGGAPGVVNAKNTTDADSLAEYLTAHGIESRAVHYQSSAGKDDLIDQLRVGDLDCLVHCNMLAEGVDLPWLTWICLRRPSASRVRFAQEVGRVVRTHRGKDRAIVLDPHDLFNSFGLDYEAVLSGGGQEDTRSEVDALADEYLAIVTDPDGEEVSHGLMRRMIARGRGVSEVRAWLRRTAFGMRAAGLEDMKIESTSWRADPASDAQLRYAHRKVRAPSIQRVAQNLDDRHRKVLRGACYALDREALTKGDVSDFLTILCVLEEHGGMPDDLDL